MKWLRLLGMILWGVAGGVSAQNLPTEDNKAANTAAEAAPPLAFRLEVEASEEVRKLLERHLDLLRYRTLTDLSDSELDRLMRLAQEDARKLLATMGYFAPEIKIERATHSATSSRVVRLTAVAGPPTLISEVNIAFTGAIANDPTAQVQRQQIKDQWPLRTDMRFAQARWDGAKQQALRQLTTQSYPSGQLASSLADIDPIGHSARLTVTLDSGPSYQLGGLVISGLERYDAALVTRLARLTPGASYKQTDLVQAQQRLADSGFFDSAYVSLDTAGDPAQAPVIVQLREAKLKKLVLGVGISTDAGPRLSAEHSHHKLPLIGWQAVSKLALDDETRSIGSELTSPPDQDNWRWVSSAQLQNQQNAGTDVTSQRLRGGRRQGSERIDRSYYLQYDRAETAATESSVPALAQTLTANYAFTWRHFDSLPFPSSGWGLGLEVGGGATLGSKKDPYARVLARVLGYLPLSRSTDDVSGALRGGRLAAHAELGAVLANDDVDLPNTQLFLTGGDTSVRGYGYRDLGVTLADGQITPGRYLAVASLEWQRPITAKGQLTDWEGTLFIDAGAVADQPAALKPKVGVGAGVRWKSPIGPLQIDLAYGVAVQRFRLHMNLGFNF